MFGLMCAFVRGSVYKITGNTIEIYGPGVVQRDQISAAASSLITKAIIQNGVTTIGERLFQDFSELESIDLGNTVTTIMAFAFQNTKIKSLSIPQSVVDINPVYLLYKNPICDSIIVDSLNLKYSSNDGILYNKDQTRLILIPPKKNNLNLPDTLLTWGGWSGYGVTLDNVIIPSSLQNFEPQSLIDATIGSITFESGSQCNLIDTKAFWQVKFNCPFICPPLITSIHTESFMTSNLTEFICTEDSMLSYLAERAFEKCRLLQTIVLPPAFERVHEKAFDGCINLKNITMLPGNANFSSFNGSIYTADLSQLVFVPPYMKEITISKDTVKIGPTVLMGTEKVSVEKGSSFVVDNDKVLYTLDYSVLRVSVGTITELTVHKDCKKIDDSVFSSFPNLVKVSFAGDKITEIGNSAFYMCQNLTEFEFKDSIETINESAFYGTPISTLTLPKNLQYIGKYSFYRSNLTIVDAGSNNALTEIGTSAFEECTLLETLTLPDSVEIVGPNAFNLCPIDHLTLPSGLKNVSENSFRSTHITEILCNPEASLGEIFSGGFAYNLYLKYVEIPPTLKKINAQAFLGCILLNNISWHTSDANPVPLLEVIAGGSFQGCTAITNFTVFSNLKEITQTAFSGCNSFLKYEITDPNQGVFDVDENGVLYKDIVGLQCSPQGKTNCLVRDTTLSIESNALYESTKLQSINFGKSKITYIGEWTFYKCTVLSSVTIPYTVNTIKKNAFLGCSALSQVLFLSGSQLEELVDSTFMQCSNLSSVIFDGESHLKTIGPHVFEMTKLVEFKFPTTVEMVDEFAFFGCKSLKTLDFSQTSLKEIKKGAFTGCLNLNSVDLPAKTTSIGDSAFAECPNIEMVIYCGLTVINDGNQFGTAKPHIYTLEKYSSSLFCGLPVESIMTRCGVFPSLQFTNEQGAFKMNAILAFAFAVITEVEYF